MVWGMGRAAEHASLREVEAGRPVLKVWLDYNIQPPSQRVIFMVA